MVFQGSSGEAFVHKWHPLVLGGGGNAFPFLQLADCGEGEGTLLCNAMMGVWGWGGGGDLARGEGMGVLTGGTQLAGGREKLSTSLKRGGCLKKW